MANIYLLCGPIASGKTYYAKRQKAANGGVHLSCDDLFLSLFDGCLGPAHQDIEDRAFRFFYTQALQFISMDLDVWLDFGFWRQKSRDEAITFFQEHHVPAFLLYFDAPQPLRLARLENRNELLQDSMRREYIIDAEKFLFLEQKFEIPEEDTVFEHIYPI